MEIKIQVNEAEILKYLMDGLTSKDIADKIRPRILNSLQSKIEEKIHSEFIKKGITLSNGLLTKQLDASCKKIVSTTLKKAMKQEFKIDNYISNILYELIEQSLNNRTLTVKI